jgi:diguanylate cyclase (GGDEF)-like protein
VRIGVSIGIAMCPEHGDDLAALLGAADRALYDAKANGRSRMSIAAPVAGPPESGASPSSLRAAS